MTTEKLYRLIVKTVKFSEDAETGFTEKHNFRCAETEDSEMLFQSHEKAYEKIKSIIQHLDESASEWSVFRSMIEEYYEGAPIIQEPPLQRWIYNNRGELLETLYRNENKLISRKPYQVGDIVEIRYDDICVLLGIIAKIVDEQMYGILFGPDKRDYLECTSSLFRPYGGPLEEVGYMKRYLRNYKRRLQRKSAR